MSLHHTTIHWQRASHDTDPETYSRNHTATLNGGQQVAVSAGADYKGDPDCADPEQLLLTALASCHMLTFLAIADIKGFRVESYQDTPVAHLEKNAEGRMAVTHIELLPQIVFGGDKQPNEAELTKLNDGAHRNCFIANSIVAKVTVTATATAASR